MSFEDDGEELFNNFGYSDAFNIDEPQSPPFDPLQLQVPLREISPSPASPSRDLDSNAYSTFGDSSLAVPLREFGDSSFPLQSGTYDLLPSQNGVVEYNPFEQPTAVVVPSNGGFSQGAIDHTESNFFQSEPGSSRGSSIQEPSRGAPPNVPLMQRMLAAPVQSTPSPPVPSGPQHAQNQQYPSTQHRNTMQQSRIRPAPAPSQQPQQRNYAPPSTTRNRNHRQGGAAGSVGEVLTSAQRAVRGSAGPASGQMSVRISAGDLARVAELTNEMNQLRSQQQQLGIDNSSRIAELEQQLKDIFLTPSLPATQPEEPSPMLHTHISSLATRSMPSMRTPAPQIPPAARGGPPPPRRPPQQQQLAPPQKSFESQPVSNYQPAMYISQPSTSSATPSYNEYQQNIAQMPQMQYQQRHGRTAQPQFPGGGSIQQPDHQVQQGIYMQSVPSAGPYGSMTSSHQPVVLSHGVGGLPHRVNTTTTPLMHQQSHPGQSGVRMHQGKMTPAGAARPLQVSGAVSREHASSSATSHQVAIPLLTARPSAQATATRIAERRGFREIRLRDRLAMMNRTVRESVDESPFKDEADIMQRLLPYHVYAEPQIKEEVLESFDSNYLRTMMNLKERGRQLENRMRSVLFDEALRNREEDEKNLLLFLDTEYEKRKFEEEKRSIVEGNPVSIDAFVQRSSIISALKSNGSFAQFEGSRKHCVPPPRTQQYEYHTFEEVVRVVSPYKSPSPVKSRCSSIRSPSPLKSCSSPTTSRASSIHSPRPRSFLSTSSCKAELSCSTEKRSPSRMKSPSQAADVLAPVRSPRLRSRLSSSSSTSSTATTTTARSTTAKSETSALSSLSRTSRSEKRKLSRLQSQPGEENLHESHTLTHSKKIGGKEQPAAMEQKREKQTEKKTLVTTEKLATSENPGGEKTPIITKTPEKQENPTEKKTYTITESPEKRDKPSGKKTPIITETPEKPAKPSEKNTPIITEKPAKPAEKKTPIITETPEKPAKPVEKKTPIITETSIPTEQKAPIIKDKRQKGEDLTEKSDKPSKKPFSPQSDDVTWLGRGDVAPTHLSRKDDSSVPLLPVVPVKTPNFSRLPAKKELLSRARKSIPIELRSPPAQYTAPPSRPAPLSQKVSTAPLPGPVPVLHKVASPARPVTQDFARENGVDSDGSASPELGIEEEEEYSTVVPRDNIQKDTSKGLEGTQGPAEPFLSAGQPVSLLLAGSQEPARPSLPAGQHASLPPKVEQRIQFKPQVPRPTRTVVVAKETTEVAATEATRVATSGYKAVSKLFEPELNDADEKKLSAVEPKTLVNSKNATRLEHKTTKNVLVVSSCSTKTFEAPSSDLGDTSEALPIDSEKNSAATQPRSREPIRLKLKLGGTAVFPSPVVREQNDLQGKGHKHKKRKHKKRKEKEKERKKRKEERTENNPTENDTTEDMNFCVVPVAGEGLRMKFVRHTGSSVSRPPSQLEKTSRSSSRTERYHSSSHSKRPHGTLLTTRNGLEDEDISPVKKVPKLKIRIGPKVSAVASAVVSEVATAVVPSLVPRHLRSPSPPLNTLDIVNGHGTDEAEDGRKSNGGMSFIMGGALSPAASGSRPSTRLEPLDFSDDDDCAAEQLRSATDEALRGCGIEVSTAPSSKPIVPSSWPFNPGQ